jgi:hypothetical protein
VLDEMSAKDDFLKRSKTFLWLDEGDSKNTMGVFLGLVLISFKIPQKGAPKCLRIRLGH